MIIIPFLCDRKTCVQSKVSHIFVSLLLLYIKTAVGDKLKQKAFVLNFQDKSLKTSAVPPVFIRKMYALFGAFIHLFSVTGENRRALLGS